jgi:hypothetical protein
MWLWHQPAFAGSQSGRPWKVNFDLFLANPYQIKTVPGRKTDARDSQWIAELLAHALIRRSLVPPRETRNLCDLTRYRVKLVEERNSFPMVRLNRTTLHRCVAFLSAALLCPLLNGSSIVSPQITATTAAWGGGAGNWTGPGANWSGTAAPNNTPSTVYEVFIASGGTDSVLLNMSPNIDSLTIGNGSSGTSALYDQANSAQTLSIAKSLALASNGGLVLNSATVSAASISNQGSLTLQGVSGSATSGDFQNSGQVSVSAGATLSVAGTLSNTNSVQANGTVSANQLTNSGSVSVGSAGILTLTRGITSIAAGSAVKNYGTVNSGGTSANTSTFHGLSNIAGTLYLNGQTNNITPSSGTLNVSGEMDVVGPASIANVAGAFALSNGASINIVQGGTLNLNAGIADVPQDTFVAVQGSLTASGHSALSELNSIEGELDLLNGQHTVVNANAGVFQNSGSLLVYEPNTALSLSEGLVNSGSLLTYFGSDVHIAGSLTNLDTGGLSVYANASLTAASVANAGLVAVYSGGSLNSGAFENNGPNGTVLVYDQQSALNASTLTNNASTLVYNHALLSANTLNNAGSLSVYGGGTVATGTFDNRDGATTWVGGNASGAPSLLQTRTFRSAGATSADSGGAILIGAGAPPGTSGYYQNATLVEIISGEAQGPASLCTGASDCGIISVADSAYISAFLYIVLTNGFDPTNGDSFVILTFKDRYTGPGFLLDTPDFNNETQYWQITYGDGFVKLTAAATPEPGPLFLLGGGLVVIGLVARPRFGHRRS